MLPRVIGSGECCFFDSFYGADESDKDLYNLYPIDRGVMGK